MRGGSVDSNGAFQAVAQVNVVGRGNCSGTLVTPLLVLTANHCVTGTSRDGFDCAGATGIATLADLTVGATVNFFVSGNGFYPGQPSLTRTHSFGPPNGSGQLVVRSAYDMDLCLESEAAADVALIRLDNDQRVPTAMIKPLNPPILGNPKLTWSPSCTTGLDSSDFTASVVGYGRTGWTWDFNPFNGDFDVVSEDGNGSRQRVFKSSSEWYKQDGVVSNDWFPTNYGGILGGDSGGATIAGGRLCGVNSRHVPNIGADWDLVSITQDSADVETAANQQFLKQHILDVTQTHFVGQCNPDDPKPWSDPALVDTDVGETMAGQARDGMPDACDPCPFETETDPRGDFTRGDDDDQDGVPDRCDNCAPGLCAAAGLSIAYCKNPYPSTFGPQPDWDGDGIGDLCDLCPMVPDAQYAGNPFLNDPDNDGVGVACDNCSKRNSVRACKTDAECSYTTAGGEAKTGFCIGLGSYGKCEDADGWACFKAAGNKDCRDGIICETFSSFGRCSQQTDDLNDNGAGGVCDSCDSAPAEAAPILMNSNGIREQFEGAPALGDACDPVPLYSSRSVKEWNAAYDYKLRTRFISSFGIGLDPDNGYQAPAVPFLRAGLRWCNCRNETELDPSKRNVPLAECVSDICVRNPTVGYAPLPGQFSNWKHVSTATYPILSSSFPGAGADQTYLRGFSSVVSTDPFWHGVGENEPQRIGLLENLFWDHHTDITSGAIDSYVQGGEVRSTGAFWSHVEDDGTTYPSQRDTDYFTSKGNALGGLRDHYTYVVTPIKPPAPMNLQVPFTKCQLLGNCNPFFRGDIVDFHLAATTPAGMSALPPSGGLVLCPNGDCGVFSAMPPIPLGGIVPPPLVAAFSDPALTFLSPVERPLQAWSEAPVNITLYASIDRSWQPGARVTSITFDGTHFGLDCRACDLPPGVAAATGASSAAEPSARTSPAYAYSAKHASIYMVGGRHPGGALTRELWRHDLLAGSWTKVLAAPPSDGLFDLAPFDVRALGFDPSRRLLAFLDFTNKQVGKNDELPVARLVTIDIARRSGKVQLVLPRVGIYERVGLVARGNGSWVLVGQVKHTKTWHAFDLELDAQGGVSWKGHAAGLGAIVDAAANTAAGVLLPVERKGKLELVRLERQDFKPSSAGCTKI
ncbi:MAG: trypsin-like serine protease [Myxococcales bacterium]|nr:trypsin-like serine protease [Myxococcales bacterium]